MRPHGLCWWYAFAVFNFIAALALTAIFHAQHLSDAVAIMLIAAALSVAQVIYWFWVCNSFER